MPASPKRAAVSSGIEGGENSAMGSVYRNGPRLFLSYKDVTGKRVARSSGIPVGKTEEERETNRKLAGKMLAELEEAIAKEAVRQDRERTSGPMTVKRFADTWIKGRRGRIATVNDEETRLKLHVLPRIGSMKLGEVKPRHVREVVRHLVDKGELSARSVRHCYGTMVTLFKAAIREELIDSNPCVLGRDELPKKLDKDPAWRATAVFTRAEVEAIISDERIAIDRRVLYGLLFLTGCRFGEVAALRWSAYDRTHEPLGMLSVHASYDVRTNKEKGVKTGVPRRVPVHPTLAKLLAAWKLSGWQELIGQAPTDDDLIIPSRRNENRRVTHGRTKFHQDLERIGLRPRRIHDTRRTFISLALADGARKDVLRWVTHGPEGDIVDLYTTLPWSALCESVAALKVTLIEGQVIEFPVAAVASAKSPEEARVERPERQSFYTPAKRTNRKTNLAEVHGNRTRRGAALTDHHRF